MCTFVIVTLRLTERICIISTVLGGGAHFLLCEGESGNLLRMARCSSFAVRSWRSGGAKARLRPSPGAVPNSSLAIIFVLFISQIEA